VIIHIIEDIDLKHVHSINSYLNTEYMLPVTLV